MQGGLKVGSAAEWYDPHTWCSLPLHSAVLNMPAMHKSIFLRWFQRFQVLQHDHVHISEREGERFHLSLLSLQKKFILHAQPSPRWHSRFLLFRSNSFYLTIYDHKTMQFGKLLKYV